MKKYIITGILVISMAAIIIYFVDFSAVDSAIDSNDVSLKLSSRGDKYDSYDYFDDTGEVSLDADVIVYETDVDGPDECSSYETYDTKNKTCSFECSNDNECARIEQDIEAELDSWVDDYTGTDDESGNQVKYSVKDILASYVVTPGEQIRLKSGSDKTVYRNIWNEVADLSPNGLSDAYIASFQIVSDSKSDTLAYVDQTGTGKWNMTINIANRNDLSIREQKMTLVHELGHIITLNSAQVNPNTRPCKNLELDEGCANTNSYIQKFVSQFWSDKKLAYNESNYVTEYAASDNVEDLAESWAVFVIGKTIDEPKTVADKKVSFFNQFPELVQMRNQMRAVLSRDIVRARKLNTTNTVGSGL